MPNHTQGNGRNELPPDESWRPQDEPHRNMRRPPSASEEDDRFEDERYAAGNERYMRRNDRYAPYWHGDRDEDGREREDWRSTERYGQGQSGYTAGRYEGDRSLDFESRNQGYPFGNEDRYRERGLATDERFAGGRGGAPYYERGYYGERYGGQGGYGRGWDGERLGTPRGYGYGDGDRGFERDEQAGRGATQQRHGTTGYQGYQGYQGSGSHEGPRDYDGGHRGKGPSGYQRSDERIREHVCEALTDDDRVDATHIDVTVQGGEVTLGGTVSGRRMKRLAEDCVENVSGVKDVHNHLRVVDSQSQRR